MKVVLPSGYCLLLSLCLLHMNTANRMVQKLLNTWWPLQTAWALNFPHTNGICVSQSSSAFYGNLFVAESSSILTIGEIKTPASPNC